MDQEAAWAQATKADPELGGHKLKESLRNARWALDFFGDAELYGYLDESGLANHPEIIRLFKRVGEAYKDDPRASWRPWNVALRPIK